MRRAACLLSLGILSFPLVAAADTGPARFAAAKLLAFDGSFPEAVAAFEQAIALGPDDPYLHLELAQALVRMAGYSRGKSRGEALKRAAFEAGRARDMAPENPDVLRLVGQIGLTLAAEDPAAAAVARDAFESLRLQRPEDPQALLALGQAQMTLDDFATAAENFRQATRLRPDQRAAFALLVEALLKSEQEDAAIAALGDLLVKFPESLDQRLLLSRLLKDHGRARDALTVLTAAPAVQAGDPELLRTVALLQYQTGDLLGALASLDSALVTLTDDDAGPVRYLRAIVLASLARNHEAEAELIRLQASAPESSDIARMLARVQERQGKWREAAALLAATAERLDAAVHSENDAAEAADIRLAWAATLSRADAWAEVAPVLEPLLKAADAAVQSQARRLYAEARYRAGDLEGAFQVLTPRSSSVLQAKRAELLLRAGRSADAKPILRRLAGAGSEGLLLAAEACQAAEAYGEAVYWLKRILAKTPDAVEPAFQLAAAYERLGRRPAAIGEFEKLLKRLPDFAPALNYLGYMLAERGERLPEAVELTLRALRLDPENGAYADSVGWAYFKRGDLDRAGEYLERAAGLIPGDATILEHLGDLYLARGDRTKASVAYERALDLAEENAAAVERKLQGLRNRS